MSDRDEMTPPLDHLPPREERDDATNVPQPKHPDTGGNAGGSRVSPETAAEPDKPDRHGIDKLPPTGR